MLDLTNYNAFIFDLDGTLLDSEKYHIAAFSKAIKEVAGYDITATDKEDFTGNTSVWLAERIARREGLPLDPHEVAERKFEYLYREFRSELYPGAEAFIRRWAGVIPLSVASNSPRHFVCRALGEAGVLACFDVITTIDDVSRKKPDPEMLLLTLSRLGMSGGEALVFEDTALGVEAAQGAGCPVVLLDNPGIPALSEPIADLPHMSWHELLLCDVPRPKG